MQSHKHALTKHFVSVKCEHSVSHAAEQKLDAATYNDDNINGSGFEWLKYFALSNNNGEEKEKKKC